MERNCMLNKFDARLKKISIIGSVGVPANYGGWETLVQHLCIELKDKASLTVYCSSLRYQERLMEFEGAKLVYIPIDANGISSIPYDILSMIHSARKADLQIILGVSGTIFLPILKLISKGRIVVNIDGLEWRREKWGKYTKWFLKFSERMAVKWADAIITDNAALQRYVEKEYNCNSLLIPYGADHVSPRTLETSTQSLYPFLNKPYAFKVARIEPENNIDMILKSFSDQTDLPLVLVGNWDSSAYGREIKSRYRSKKSLYLLDAIYDQNILDQIRSNCKIYIHGHSAGGTNPSLVEAMSLKLPILAYDVSFNRETTENEAFYFNSIENLQELFSKLSDQELKICSEKMTTIANRRYKWSIISNQYFELV
jgi:glycosyltransferase involved in cell wall biosynthesis